MSDYEHYEKKERLLDTLLLITGFVFASSISSMSITYLMTVLVFLACCIFLKSCQQIEIMPDSIRTVVCTALYILISFLFPIVLISVYFTKNLNIDTSGTILFFTSLLSTVLLLSFMGDSTKDYGYNLRILMKIRKIMSMPLDIATFIIPLSIPLLIIAVVIIYLLIQMPVVLFILIIALMFLPIILKNKGLKHEREKYTSPNKSGLSNTISEIGRSLIRNKSFMLIYIFISIYLAFFYLYLISYGVIQIWKIPLMLHI